MVEDNDKEDQGVRLNKYIANSGLCSRRAADEIIKQKRVKINNKLVSEMGYKVRLGDVVTVDNKPINAEGKVYVLLNKPRNTISTRKDERGRKTVMDLLPKKWSHLYPVGRVDRNTTGVLLITNDGNVTNALLHPSKKIKKVYKAKIKNRLSQEELDLLVTGVELEDGVSKFNKIVELHEDNEFRYGIEIHSGKNRIVRRMFESIGNEVVKLDRVLFHNFDRRGIKRGDFRELKPREVTNLINQLNLKK